MSRRLLPVLVLLGLGALFAVLPIVHLVVHPEPLAPTILGKVLPFVAALFLLGSGVWLHCSDLTAANARRIVCWAVAGLVGFGAINSLMVVHMSLVEASQMPTETVLFSIANVATGGTIAGIGIGIYDVRARRQRAQLRRKNEKLEAFADVVSHDLRNPLNIAQGRLELAQQRYDDEDLDSAIQALDRPFELIEDLLAMARAEQPVTEFERVDLGELARRSWQTVRTGNASLQVRTDRVIRAEESRLRQLLENLFRNSVEHGSTTQSDDGVEHGGEDVTITVGDLPDGFYVEDDGPGIPPENREQVFESGFTTGEDGAGLGLGIVAQIVEAHGWSVRITESDAGGARFEFTGVESTE